MKNLEQCTDEELVENFQNGDKDSIDFLLNKYKSLASKLARTYFLVGGDIEDLLQEAMIGLYKSCNYYNRAQNTKFFTYAYRCMNSQIVSAIRIANAKKNNALNTSLSFYTKTLNDEDFKGREQTLLNIPDENDPENIFIKKERVSNIYNLISTLLSAKEQKVFVEYLKGYSYYEIAEALKLSPKTIDNAIARAKKKLITALNND